MAGSQSFTPKKVKPSRPKRRFTIAQANSTLPLVGRIVRDIVRAHGEALKVQDELQHLASGKRQQEAQGRLEGHLERIEDYVDELTEVGCDLKDYEKGLIDFTGRHQGRDVCLCWKLGEDRIGYWHEQDAGFAGRQPIGTLKEE